MKNDNYVPLSQGTLDFSKSQNTQLINVIVVLEVDGEGLSTE